MCRPDLTELVDYGTEQGLRMTLTPSGTASLTPGGIEALADAGLQRLALSIDGPDAASHDGFRGVSGSFDATMAAADAAAAADVPLQVNTTVCAETVDQLPAIYDLVAEREAVLWSVFFLVPVGRGAVLTPIDPSRAEAVMGWLHDVAAEAPFGVKTTEAPMYRRVVAQKGDADGPARRAGVRAGKGFAFVSHVGEVYPSGFLPAAAGNVREQSIVDIYRDARLFRRLRDDEALRGKCGACEFRHRCGGSRSRAYAYSGDPLASDPLCPYVPSGYSGDRPAKPAAHSLHQS
jgi:radical SAM protein with 4Fe4S-binding SPASM domain